MFPGHLNQGDDKDLIYWTIQTCYPECPLFPVNGRCREGKPRLQAFGRPIFLRAPPDLEHLTNADNVYKRTLNGGFLPKK